MLDFMKQMEKELREDQDLARLTNQEEFILDVTELILEKIESKDLNKSQLAERLNTNKSHVTQLLRGSRNMTLRTVADIFFVLDQKVMIDAIPTEEYRGHLLAEPLLYIQHDQTPDWKQQETTAICIYANHSQNHSYLDRAAS